MIRSHARLTLLSIFCLMAGSALACKLPVFRYALERWPADRYRMVAIVQDRQSDGAREAIKQLHAQASSNANVDLEVVELSTMSDDDFWQLEGIDGDIETPHLQVFYPERKGQRKMCWQGPLTPEGVGPWFDSPIRRQINRMIASGVSAVWLLVDGANERENQRTAEIARGALSRASQQITIPEGVISRQRASQYLSEHPEASMDDVLRSDIPLRVDFQLLRLSRDDPNEAALRAMIAGLAGETDGAVLVPIFGRGRMFDAISAADADEHTLLNACRYLVGECSCTVKTLNPGVDLLLTADWQEQLGQADVVVISRIDEPTLVPIPTGRFTPHSAANDVSGTRPRWLVVSILLVGFSALALLRRRASNGASAQPGNHND